jgi:hypothetical protein
MAERRIAGDDDGRHRCVGCLVSCSSGLGKRGWQRLWIAFVMVLLEYIVTISRVKDLKAQGLPFIGCTWQWPC